MALRRVAGITREPRERIEFDLNSLLQGGNGLLSTAVWVAHSPHADGEVLLEVDEVVALGQLNELTWSVDCEAAAGSIERLRSKRLVVSDVAEDAELRGRDDMGSTR